MDRWQHSSPCWKPPRVSRGSSSSAPPGQPLLPKPGWICESPEHLHEACFSARRLKRTCWGTEQVSSHFSKYFTQLTNNFQNDHGNLQNLKAYCSWSMLSMSGFRQLSKKTSATENRWSTVQHRGHTSLHYCIFILHTGHGGFFRGGTKRRPSGQAPVMSQYPKLLQEEALEKLLPLQLVLLLLIFSETAQLRTVIQVCLHLWPHPENQISPFFPKVLFQTFLDGGCLQ